MKNGQIIKMKTLQKGWHNNDEIMLHSCFYLLKNFIDKEHPFKYGHWDTNEETIAVSKEMEFLYAWWKKRKKIETSFDMLNNKLSPQNIEDDEMLMRLVKIRLFLCN